jgi:predicted esterase
MTDTPEQHTFSARLDCRYLLHTPKEARPGSVLVLTLHGYGSNPEAMLHLTRGLVGSECVIASVQAPNQFYTSQTQRGSEPPIGYNWGVRDHWAAAVRLHHDMVREALSSLRVRFGLGSANCMLVGFSQPVGLNYRFAATWPDEVRGVIGICGGVPRDWEEDKYRPVTASLLHIARQEDEFYPPEMSMQFGDRLRNRARDVEFHMLPGGHRFPSKARHIVNPWMARVFGTEEREETATEAG